MPDSWEWKLVSVRVKDDGALNARVKKLLANFPPDTMNNLPIDFLMRCKMDPRAEFPNCVVLCYADGTVPNAVPDEIHAKTYPTYKNLPGKKVSAMAMAGDRVKRGTAIKLECGNLYCVNQKHLIVTNTVIDNGKAAAETYRKRREEGYYGETS